MGAGPARRRPAHGQGLPARPDPFATQSLELPGLRCEVASPEMELEMVLVLKALVHRIGEDDDDLRLLAAHAGLGSAEEVLDLVENVAGPRLLTAQVQFFVEAAMDADPGA